MSVAESDLRGRLLEVLEHRKDEVIDRWVGLQLAQAARTLAPDPRSLRDEARELVEAVRDGLASGLPLHRIAAEFEPLRRAVQELSVQRARQGSTPTATAFAVLGLKYACVDALRESGDRESGAADDDTLVETVVSFGRMIDAAGLLTFETYVQGREDIIRRQNQQLLELSTPVVQLWDRVLGVPLIGTLDSARTQVVTESLLQAIEDREALVAIIDITGVPMVDTLVAQHLLETVTATRLMGADCIISGIRPQTAQTIAQLGIDLADIITRASLADALATAMALVRRADPSAVVPGEGRVAGVASGSSTL